MPIFALQMSNDNGSTQPTPFPLWRRIGIVACVSLGALFAVRAATAPATATPTIQPDVETTRAEREQVDSAFSPTTARRERMGTQDFVESFGDSVTISSVVAVLSRNF